MGEWWWLLGIVLFWVLCNVGEEMAYRQLRDDMDRARQEGT